MKSLDTIIFDFDGILFDTEEINYIANEKTFNEFNLSFSREQYSKLWIEEGLDMEDIIEKFKLRIKANSLRERKNKFFLELTENNPIALMDGIRENIEQLLSMNYKIAIASSNLKKNILHLLKNSGTNFPFTPIIGKEDIVNPKPHPEVFLKCLAKMNSDPQKSVVIEDATKGIISAKKCNIKHVIAIPNTWTNNCDFSAASLILPSAKSLSTEIISEKNLL